MEKNDGIPAMPLRSLDEDDSNYVSGLSTIFVATIQEAKDRISQIEFLFCNQLYPCIQSRSKHFRRVLAEAKKEVEDSWRIKEKALLERIHNLEMDRKGMVANSVCLDLEKRMKEQEDENHRLKDELTCLKTDKESAIEGKVLIDEKRRRLESHLAENNELLKEYEREKTELMCNLRLTEHANSGLRERLETKNQELHSERVLTAQLQKKVDSNVDQIIKQGEKLKEMENEKELLIGKVTDLQKQVIELQGKLDYSPKLSSSSSLHQPEETKKFKALVEAYKKARSENNYLRKKLDLKEENMIQPSAAPLIPKKEEEEEMVENKTRSCRSSSSTCLIPPKTKSSPKKAIKQQESSWINTRTHQSKVMADHHDDFLDTPLESIKEKLSKSAAQESDHLQAPVEDGNLRCSDCQEPEAGQVAVRQSLKRSFKFIETVRTKAEREKLKGVECKQCKKFYDAVLPDRGEEVKDKQDLRRCEHDEGVSKHRYRYVPPSTPEGFWNIGFDSEIN